jgi:hypothetical protein
MADRDLYVELIAPSVRDFCEFINRPKIKEDIQTSYIGSQTISSHLASALKEYGSFSRVYRLDRPSLLRTPILFRGFNKNSKSFQDGFYISGQMLLPKSLIELVSLADPQSPKKINVRFDYSIEGEKKQILGQVERFIDSRDSRSKSPFHFGIIRGLEFLPELTQGNVLTWKVRPLLNCEQNSWVA